MSLCDELLFSVDGGSERSYSFLQQVFVYLVLCLGLHIPHAILPVVLRGREHSPLWMRTLMLEGFCGLPRFTQLLNSVAPPCLNPAFVYNVSK